VLEFDHVAPLFTPLQIVATGARLSVALGKVAVTSAAQPDGHVRRDRGRHASLTASEHVRSHATKTIFSQAQKRRIVSTVTSAPENGTADNGAEPARGGESLDYPPGQRPQLEALRWIAVEIGEQVPGIPFEVALACAVLLDQGRVEESVLRIRDARERIAKDDERRRAAASRGRGAL
jgi:hypothetical protein